MIRQWLIVVTPTGVHCWNVGDVQDLDGAVLRARTMLGMPPGDDWVTVPNGWDVHLSHGEPHPRLLARATVHDVADLAEVVP